MYGITTIVIVAQQVGGDEIGVGDVRVPGVTNTTHLSLSRDLTGNLARISNTISSGRFLWDMSLNGREKKRATPVLS